MSIWERLLGRRPIICRHITKRSVACQVARSCRLFCSPAPLPVSISERLGPKPGGKRSHAPPCEGGGTGEHAYGQGSDRSLAAPDEQVCRRRGHRRTGASLRLPRASPECRRRARPSGWCPADIPRSRSAFRSRRSTWRRADDRAERCVASTDEASFRSPAASRGSLAGAPASLSRSVIITTRIGRPSDAAPPFTSPSCT